jgi:hypothetical protein
VLTFFIAGLLYLLRFERVDNLGAYSIPFGDRPSHPIRFCQLSESIIRTEGSLGLPHISAAISRAIRAHRSTQLLVARCCYAHLRPTEFRFSARKDYHAPDASDIPDRVSDRKKNRCETGFQVGGRCDVTWCMASAECWRLN